MSIRFSEDLFPLTDLKADPGRVVKHATEVHRPVLLTSRGQGVAVVQSFSDYEKGRGSALANQTVIRLVKFGILSAKYSFDLNTVDIMAGALTCWGKQSA